MSGEQCDGVGKWKGDTKYCAVRGAGVVDGLGVGGVGEGECP